MELKEGGKFIEISRIENLRGLCYEKSSTNESMVNQKNKNKNIFYVTVVVSNAFRSLTKD